METQLYDLYIQADADSEPDVPADMLAQYGMLDRYWESDDYLNLSLPKEVAFIIAKAIEKKDGVALVYPKQYRHPRVSYEQSKQIAFEYYQQLIEKEPNRYGKIKEMEYNPIWYNYVADDYVLQEQGWIPGFKGLPVDKLSGKILSKEEYTAFYKLLHAWGEIAYEDPIRPR